MLEFLTPRYAAGAKELLPGVVAVLIVLLALSIPVVLILWRLHRPYS